MVRALLSVPQKASPGEIVEIKALISHPMESGYRVGYNGALLPRDIIQMFVCTYNGVEIFRADFSPAIAANPFISFHTVATETGMIEFRWTGDNGFSVTESAPIIVA
jgi:sulfur-oxidizing protein SoxZ